MNVPPHLTKTLLVLIALAMIAAKPAPAENLPDMRPALIGSGPNSLVNLISTKHLMERGVKHGELFLYASDHRNGFPTNSTVWGVTMETEPLRKELIQKLSQARLITAVYQHPSIYAG